VEQVAQLQPERASHVGGVAAGETVHSCPVVAAGDNQRQAAGLMRGALCAYPVTSADYSRAVLVQGV
jgi:hypothetical protein